MLVVTLKTTKHVTCLLNAKMFLKFIPSFIGLFGLDSCIISQNCPYSICPLGFTKQLTSNCISSSFKSIIDFNGPDNVFLNLKTVVISSKSKKKKTINYCTDIILLKYK